MPAATMSKRKVTHVGSPVAQPWNVIDLFCGTGGFSHGFEKGNSRFKVLYAIDMDPDASATARANHPGCIVDTADVRKVTPADVARRLQHAPIDVIIGGPPCQGFSSLRPNRSSPEEDERNDLYKVFADFVEHFQPRVAVLENVVGLITHNGGRTLRKILRRFAQLGYAVDWRILNAAAYGVPQKRERFIMIASRVGPISFPATTHYFEGKVIGHHDKSRHMPVDPRNPAAVTVEEAIGDLPELGRRDEARRYTKEPLTLYQRERRGDCVDLTLHYSANHSDKMMKVMRHAGESIRSIPKGLITGGFSSSYSRLAPDEPSTTITVKFQSPASNKCIHPYQTRTITPREAARLQSFDDSFVFEGTSTKISSQIGNAVPPLLGKAIATTVAQMLEMAEQVIAVAVRPR